MCAPSSTGSLIVIVYSANARPFTSTAPALRFMPSALKATAFWPVPGVPWGPWFVQGPGARSAHLRSQAGQMPQTVTSCEVTRQPRGAWALDKELSFSTQATAPQAVHTAWAWRWAGCLTSS